MTQSKHACPQFASFEDWVESIFGSDATGEDPECIGATLDPQVTLEYLTELFLNARSVLAGRSDVDVARGLNYIASNGESDTIYVLLDEAAPWPARQKCIRAMYSLVTDCFVERCDPNNFAVDGAGGNIGFVCRYWFDLMPFHGTPRLPRDVNAEFLDLYRKLLAEDSDICRITALSGLGSWILYQPKPVKKILDGFVASGRLSRQTRELVDLTRRGLNTL